jgi:hypothetical protein
MYASSMDSGHPQPKGHYKKYCEIPSNDTEAAKQQCYNKQIMGLNNRIKVVSGGETASTNISNTETKDSPTIINAFSRYFLSVTKNISTDKT